MAKDYQERMRFINALKIPYQIDTVRALSIDEAEFVKDCMWRWCLTLTVVKLKKLMRYIGVPASDYNYMKKEAMRKRFEAYLGSRIGYNIQFIQQCCQSTGCTFNAYYPLNSAVYIAEKLSLFNFSDERWDKPDYRGEGDEEGEDKGEEKGEEEKPKHEEETSMGEEAKTEEFVPKPAAGTLEGALFELVNGAIGGKIEQALTSRGLTKESVEAIIEQKLETIEVPKFFRESDGETPQVVHPGFERMTQMISIGESPYLLGPAGSGKTHASMQFAQMIKREITIISCNEEMSTTDLTGYMDFRGEYVESALYKAWIAGHVILFDEADKCPGPVLVALNAAVAQRRMLFPCGTLEAHEDVICIFTGNTRMSGASATYSTGQRQDESLKNRLLTLEWDYDLKLERTLVRSIAKAHELEMDKAMEWLSYVRKVRKAIDKMGLSYVAGPRQSMAGAKLLSLGIEETEVREHTMYGWMRPEDATRVKQEVGE